MGTDTSTTRQQNCIPVFFIGIPMIFVKDTDIPLKVNRIKK